MAAHTALSAVVLPVPLLAVIFIRAFWRTAFITLAITVIVLLNGMMSAFSQISSYFELILSCFELKNAAIFSSTSAFLSFESL